MSMTKEPKYFSLAISTSKRSYKLPKKKVWELASGKLAMDFKSIIALYDFIILSNFLVINIKFIGKYVAKVFKMIGLHKSSGENGPDEFFVVKTLIFLDFEFSEKLSEFLLSQLLPQIRHHIPELFNCYCVTLWFEDGVHGFNKLVLCLWLFVLTASVHLYLAIKARNSANSNLPVFLGSICFIHLESYYSVGVWYSDLTSRGNC